MALKKHNEPKNTIVPIKNKRQLEPLKKMESKTTEKKLVPLAKKETASNNLVRIKNKTTKRPTAARTNRSKLVTKQEDTSRKGR